MASDLELILGGAKSANDAYAPYEQRRQQELSSNVQLSDYEKQLGGDFQSRLERAQQLVLSGRDPREVAILMKHGLPLEQVPQVPPQSSQQPPSPMAAQPQQSSPYGYTPGMGQAQPPAPMAQAPQQQAPQAPAFAPGMGSPVGSRISQMSGPVESPGFQGGRMNAPQTRGDMEALMRMGPMLTKQPDSPEDKLTRLMLALNSKEGIAGQSNTTRQRGQDVRGNIEAAKLTESGRQADQTNEYRYDALKASMERVIARQRSLERMRTSQDKTEVEALKLRNSGILKKEGMISSLTGSFSYLNKDPAVLQHVEELKAEVAAENAQLDQDVKMLQARGTTRGQGGGTAAPVPGGPAEPPLNGAPPLNTGTPVREPGGVDITRSQSSATSSASPALAPAGYQPTGTKAPAGKPDGSYQGGKFVVVNGMIFKKGQ